MTDDDRIFRFDQQQKRIGARQSGALPRGGTFGQDGGFGRSFRDNASPNAYVACRR